MLVKANLLVSNNQPESRMREIRQSGSVGGEPKTKFGFPTSIRQTSDGIAKRWQVRIEC